MRKVFTTGNVLNAIGARHKSVTPVYKAGNVDATGTLNGNLVLVASGDLATLIDLLTKRTSRHFSYRIVPQTNLNPESGRFCQSMGGFGYWAKPF